MKTEIKTINEFREHIHGFWNSRGQEVDIKHCVLGIKSEIGELDSCYKKKIGYGRQLDESNLIEELGDLYFFTFKFIELLELEIPDLIDAEHLEDRVNYVIGSDGNIDDDDIIEVLQKLSLLQIEIYSLLLDFEKEHITKKFYALLDTITLLVKSNGFYVSNVLATNVNKLTVRFGGQKYNDEKVLSRDLGLEKQILQKGAKTE